MCLCTNKGQFGHFLKNTYVPAILEGVAEVAAVNSYLSPNPCLNSLTKSPKLSLSSATGNS